MPRHRRTTVGVILGIALVIGFLAVLSTWVKRQVLDTHHWTNTSSKLLADKEIQNTLGVYLADQVFNGVDVAGALRGTLPPQAAALAGPAAGALHELATRTAPAILARPRVQDAWRSANQAAHKQLVNVIDGGGNVVGTNNGNVTLDLHTLVNQLASTLGVEKQVAAARAKANLAPAGQLTIMKSSQLGTAQDIANGVKSLSIGLTIIAIGLWGIALWLAAGWRRLVLRRIGWSFIAIGLVALLVRRVAGNQVVDSLVRVESNKPAVHDVWNIATSLLYTIAVSMIVYGIFLTFTAWLAGDTRPATAVRQELAPVMRDRMALIYGPVAVLYLLLLAWGPTPAFRNVVPVVLIAGLIVLGVEVLRRQTAKEFPDAVPGDGVHAFRAWVRRDDAKAVAVAGGNGEHGRVEDLERLAALHSQGALSDDEFRSEKASLMGYP